MRPSFVIPIVAAVLAGGTWLVQAPAQQQAILPEEARPAAGRDGCNVEPPLVITQPVLFSELDGSAADHDGVPDGVLELDGLRIVGWGKLLVDIPWGRIHAQGDIVLRDDGKIDHPDWPMPNYGPSYLLLTCGSIILRDRARIRSHGVIGGGRIDLCAVENVVLDGLAGIECGGFDVPDGLAGGGVYCNVGGRFELASILSYITVEARYAGVIDVAACSFEPDAIRVKGKLLANGKGRDGVGGYITLDARNGGIWLPGSNNCLAVGDDPGEITLAYRTLLRPIFPPLVTPPAILIPDGPDNGPCVCPTE